MRSWASRTAVGPGKALNSSKRGACRTLGTERSTPATSDLHGSPRTSEVGGQRERVRFDPLVEIRDGVTNHSAELSETGSPTYASILFQRPGDKRK